MRFLNRTLILSLALMLAACGGTDAAPTTPPETAAPQSNAPIVPTLPAPPPWVEAAEPLTLENVPQARPLGRLDPPGTLSTLFWHDFSPDSTRLAGLNNDLLLAWDLITGRLAFSIPRQNSVQAHYSSDKTELYAIDLSGFVLIYDAEAGTVKNSFEGHPTFSNVAAYYDDADLMALGGFGGVVKVWDTFARQSLVTLETQLGDVLALAFSPDGETLAIGGRSGVELWAWRSRERLGALEQPEAEFPVRLAFSPDGTQIAVGGNASISIFSTADYSQLYRFDTGAGGVSDVLLYSPDGRFLVNGGIIPNMLVWDMSDGTLLSQLPGVGGDRVSASFSPDGNMLLTGRLDGVVTLWNIAGVNPDESTIPSAPIETEEGQRILYVDWTPDGFLMTFFDALGPVYIWGVAPEGE